MSHNNWMTPPDFFRVINKEFHFDLDAAASLDNALCPMCITKEDDALITPWAAPSVYCNPPYTLIGPFVKRAWEQSREQGNLVAVLLPAYTDPRYWSDYVMQAHEIRFLKGRLKFVDEDNQVKTSARFPSVLVIFKELAGKCYGKGPNQFVWDWRV